MSSKIQYDEINSNILTLTMDEIKGETAKLKELIERIKNSATDVRKSIELKAKFRGYIYVHITNRLAHQSNESFLCNFKQKSSDEKKMKKDMYRAESAYSYDVKYLPRFFESISCSTTEDLTAFAKWLERWAIIAAILKRKN